MNTRSSTLVSCLVKSLINQKLKLINYFKWSPSSFSRPKPNRSKVLFGPWPSRPNFISQKPMALGLGLLGQSLDWAMVGLGPSQQAWAKYGPKGPAYGPTQLSKLWSTSIAAKNLLQQKTCCLFYFYFLCAFSFNNVSRSLTIFIHQQVFL